MVPCAYTADTVTSLPSHVTMLVSISTPYAYIPNLFTDALHVKAHYIFSSYWAFTPHFKNRNKRPKRGREWRKQIHPTLCAQAAFCRPLIWLHRWENKIHKSERIGGLYKHFRTLSCFSELTSIYQKYRGRLYMAPSVQWNTSINFQNVDLSNQPNK